MPLPATAAQAIGGHSASFYSAQLDTPPLPFNPYPDLILYEVFDGFFVYDDRNVNYVQTYDVTSPPEDPCTTCSTNLPPAPPPPPVCSGLCLQVNRTGTNSYSLFATNLTPGHEYVVATKLVFVPDITQQWTPITLFTAATYSASFSLTISGDQRFFEVWDLNLYQGPVVSITGAAPDSSVSGDVVLRAGIADIFPVSMMKVYVGATEIATIRPGEDGTISVPTYLFPNGQQQIWVEALDTGVLVDSDGDGVTDSTVTFQGWGSVTLNFTNDVYMQNYSLLYSAAGSVTLQYGVTSAQNYTFEVFRTNGTLLHTASGTSASGTISGDWNFADLSGNSVDDGVYVFSLTYSPQGGALISENISTTNFFDHGVTVGKYVLSYGTWPDSSDNDGLASLSRALSIRVNSAAYFDEDVIGPRREAYGVVQLDFSSAPIAIRRSTQTNDLMALTNALADITVGSWWFDGHASGYGLIFSETDRYLEVSLIAKDVAALLGNQYGYSHGLNYNVKYTRRLFSTMITGCSSAANTNEIAEAVGTPIGIQQVGNSQLQKSAYLGFTGVSKVGSTFNNWFSRLHQIWIDFADYDTPLQTAMDNANAAYSEVRSWGPLIFGFPPLKYNGDDSR